MAASVQAELLAIGGEIARVEPVAMYLEGSRVSIGWANVAKFTPGLFALIQLAGGTKDETIQKVDFGVLEPGRALDELELLTVSAEREADCYENPDGAYFLNAFRRYRDRPHPLVPAGMAGYSELKNHVAPNLFIPPPPPDDPAADRLL